MSKGEETRQFIIESAAPIFNTKGIAATAMSDLMEATKLSKGSLYVHFENKDNLALAAIDYNLNKLEEKVGAQLRHKKTFKDKLFAYADAFLDPLNPPVTGGCPMMNFGMEADDTNETIRKRVSVNVVSAQELIVQFIEGGIKAGEFKADWAYKEFATVMFAMIEGGIMISRIMGNNQKMKIINAQIKKMIKAELL